MLRKIKNIWKKYDYWIFIGSCILFFIILSLKENNKHGTFNGRWWTTPFIKKSNISSTPTKKVIKESKGELECKRVLENIFRMPFKKDRPDFLKNNVNGGYNLELDLVNYDLGLAVEYSGKQHYEFTKFFHKNHEHFLNQKYRDEIKRMKCKDYGLVLIEVPYNVKIDDIDSYIRNELYKNGFKISN